MKAKPVKLVRGEGYIACDKNDATHLTINIPGPTGMLTLPVITKGRRDGTGCWTWNGCIDAPTLKPSVLTKSNDFRCHSWINSGQVKFLGDCSHDMAGKTLDLLEVI